MVEGEDRKRKNDEKVFGYYISKLLVNYNFSLFSRAHFALFLSRGANCTKILAIITHTLFPIRTRFVVSNGMID